MYSQPAPARRQGRAPTGHAPVSPMSDAVGTPLPQHTHLHRHERTAGSNQRLAAAAVVQTCTPPPPRRCAHPRNGSALSAIAPAVATDSAAAAAPPPHASVRPRPRARRHDRHPTRSSRQWSSVAAAAARPRRSRP